MSFGFLGIQFGFALQNANVSRIFQTLGAKIEDIPILWIAAPVTGLIIQPIIGHMSDHTWNRLGRRRPYFLSGAILASVALLVMPNSPVLWVAAGMLWIMDASINISMEPFRAFVGDNLSSDQRTKGFAMQSFFIGTGAIVGSALPYLLTNVLNIPNTAPEGMIPMSVKLSFYIGAFAFFTAVLWTVIRTKEYSPVELKQYSEEETSTKNIISNYDSQTYLLKSTDINRFMINGVILILVAIVFYSSSFYVSFNVNYYYLYYCLAYLGLIQFIVGLLIYNNNIEINKFIKNGISWLLLGSISSLAIYHLNANLEIYVLTLGISFFGIVQFVAGILINFNKKNGLTDIIVDMFKMPKTMLQLSFVQFFTWFALFAMWIYTTAAVTKHIYGTTDTSSALFNKGANWVGICFAAYNGFAAIVSFLLPPLARLTNRKIVHTISLVIGGLSLMSIFVIKTPEMLLLPMLGIGLAWASILSMPYAILAGALPSNKMGIYMGIFNFFIVIPQICAASILGLVTKTLFHGEAVYALILGGISMIVAAGFVLFVKDVD